MLSLKSAQPNKAKLASERAEHMTESLLTASTQSGELASNPLLALLHRQQIQQRQRLQAQMWLLASQQLQVQLAAEQQQAAQQQEQQQAAMQHQAAQAEQSQGLLVDIALSSEPSALIAISS